MFLGIRYPYITTTLVTEVIEGVIATAICLVGHQAVLSTKRSSIGLGRGLIATLHRSGCRRCVRGSSFLLLSTANQRLLEGLV